MQGTTKTVYDLEGGIYVKKLASELKNMKEFEMPKWAHYVKTSRSKERPPADDNWWWMRAASILRQIYLNGVVGVNRLSTKYGSKQNRGMAPPHFARGGRKIIRTILQQAEKAELLEKVKEPKAGRKLTKKGKQFLDEVSGK